MGNKDTQVRQNGCFLRSKVVCWGKHKYLQIKTSAFLWKQNRQGPYVIWWKSLVYVSSECRLVGRSHRKVDTSSAELPHRTVYCVWDQSWLQTVRSRFDRSVAAWGSCSCSSPFLAWESSSGLKLWLQENLCQRSPQKHQSCSGESRHGGWSGLGASLVHPFPCWWADCLYALCNGSFLLDSFI